MTHNEDLPPAVRQFILTRIDSVPHLEALLLIWGHGAKMWAISDLAKSLFVSPAVAKKIAGDLLRRGWIKRAAIKQDGFEYDPAWDPAGEFMTQLADTYRTKLVRVATLIHSNASAAVRDFSDAFDLKKE